MSSEFLDSSWKKFCGCGILCVQMPNYAVLFHGLKFHGSPLNHENHKKFKPLKNAVDTAFSGILFRKPSGLLVVP